MTNPIAGDSRVQDLLASYQTTWQATAKAADAPPATKPTQSADRLAPSGGRAGRSTAQLPFIGGDSPAATTLTGVASYGAHDSATLVSAFDGLQQDLTAKGTGLQVAVTVPLTVVAGLNPTELAAGIQGGVIAPMSQEVLTSGTWLAQTGAYNQIHDAALVKVNMAKSTLAAERRNLRPDELVHADIKEQGIEVVTVVATAGVEQANATRDGDKPVEIVVTEVVPLGVAGHAAAAPATMSPALAKLPPEVAKTIMTIVGKTDAKPAASGVGPGGRVQGTRRTHCVHLGDTRREQMLGLAGDYSRGDQVKLKQFQAAVQVASTEGLRLTDPQFAPVISYLTKLTADNPALRKLLMIDNGILWVRPIPQLFTSFDKVNSFAGVAMMLTNNDPAGQLLLRDIFRAATTKEGLDLSDARLGPMAKQALLLAKQNAAILGQDLFVEKDGRAFMHLDDKSKKELDTYFAFYSTNQHSDAAKRVDAAQNEAATGMNASITASASALVVMHLFEKLETDGRVPIPTVAPGAAAPIRAGPTRHGHAHPVKDAPPKVDPPPMPTAPPLSLPMRELPKTHEAPAAIRQRAEAALNSYITDQSKADGDHSLTREQRQRAEGQRQNEIRQAADSAAQRYVTSLDSAQAQKQVVRKDAEIATVATVQTSDGQTQTVVVDRANRVHYDEPQAAG